MEVTVKKLHKPAIVYKIAPSGNSEVAGRKTVRVASVGDKNAFAGICRLSEYFPSSFFWLEKVTPSKYLLLLQPKNASRMMTC